MSKLKKQTIPLIATPTRAEARKLLDDYIIATTLFKDLNAEDGEEELRREITKHFEIEDRLRQIVMAQAGVPGPGESVAWRVGSTLVVVSKILDATDNEMYDRFHLTLLPEKRITASPSRP